MATIAGPRAATSFASLQSTTGSNRSADSSNDSGSTNATTSRKFPRYRAVSTGNVHIPAWEPSNSCPTAVTLAQAISWDTRVHERLSNKWVDSIPPLKRLDAYTLIERLVLTLNNPAYIPYPTVHDPIIIAIDLEHFPVREDRQTEVGLAILDTATIKGTTPGPYADYWIQQVRARHLRVWETGTWITYAKNKATGERLWAGNKFQFGTSEWRQVPDIYKEIEEVLRVSIQGRNRPVILVSHHWSQQEQFLSNLFVDQGHLLKRFRLTDFGSIASVIDTESLVSSIGTPRVDLSGALHMKGYSELIRHNAGNDAMYTMILLLRLATDTTMPPNRHAAQQYLIRHTPQELLRRLVLQRLKYRIPLNDGRCSACGRLGHSDVHCVWLNCCAACGKNGFCAHRPKPKDGHAHSPVPPSRPNYGLHITNNNHNNANHMNNNNNHNNLNHMNHNNSNINHINNIHKMNTIITSHRRTTQDNHHTVPAPPPRSAPLHHLPPSPLPLPPPAPTPTATPKPNPNPKPTPTHAQIHTTTTPTTPTTTTTKDLRAEAPIFRPTTTTTSHQKHHPPTPQHRRLPPSHTAAPPSQSPPRPLSPRTRLQNHAAALRAKVLIERRITMQRPAFAESVTEPNEAWGAPEGGYNACLRHVEVDHQVRFCPRRRENYGW
ncbi:hypothetical protein EJ05DRAFT_538203 [Pseudovirgaria hyperparasitica]|uniref:Gfd2/YDR514C-like C-terminal domain-containing protein n=1 Tax=Pseudovirgaria hyperparasitica TaxID=470096 RepID=A0A6A6W7C4_9PEZI|nr:uncharacterized protein EJ05DRAFT_538203 [Pseudovirgaria hyperparasitica]KAF2757924.1 hypothetical protein EJ05DRAFT_538203 [Pseudovirgaria hyperparasitica]